MNNVMIGMFWSVLDMLKNCNNKARLAVTTYFNGAIGNVVECGNGFCDNDDCKDATKFSAVQVDMVRLRVG
jgi:hypothetical protein